MPSLMLQLMNLSGDLIDRIYKSNEKVNLRKQQLIVCRVERSGSVGRAFDLESQGC